MECTMNNSVNINFFVNELVESSLLDSIIYDCMECCILEEDACLSLMDELDLKMKASKFISQIEECLQKGLVPNEKVGKVFYKNGFQCIAECIYPQYAGYYDTRDSESNFGGDLQTLPYMRSSASLPVLSNIPHSEDKSLELHTEHMNDAVKQPFEIKVIPSRFLYGGRQHIEGVYKNESTPRGYMFLVNISKFANDVFKHREGSLVDARNLKLLFSQMGYAVEEHENLTYMELKKALCNFSDDERLKSVDSCVVAIMSHGVEDKIITADCRQIDWRDIRDYFSNVNCPNLLGKPKIFIFQCCRGTTPDVGVEIQSSLSYISNVHHESDYVTVDGTAMGQTIPITTHPTNTDMYIIFATIEGYVAYLNKERGSWLVEALCIEFMQHAHDNDLDDLMKKVGKRLCNFHSDKGRKQISELRNYAFLKDFYFNPHPSAQSSTINLSDLNQALPHCVHSSYSCIPSSNPRHREREGGNHSSLCSTPEPSSMESRDINNENQNRLNYYDNSRRSPYNNSTFNMGLYDYSRRNSDLKVSGFQDQFEQRELLNPQFTLGDDVVDVSYNNTKSFERSTYRSRNISNSSSPNIFGTAEDFHNWRMSFVKDQGIDDRAASCNLKRQLSIPSESEAMTKLHSLSNYLQVNELEEFIPALEPIRDVILKNKNKHKKKKGQSNSLEI